MRACYLYDLRSRREAVCLFSFYVVEGYRDIVLEKYCKTV